MPDPGNAMEGERDLVRTRLAGVDWHPGDAIATWDVAGSPPVGECSRRSPCETPAVAEVKPSTGASWSEALLTDATAASGRH
jgi:hypothetical protein